MKRIIFLFPLLFSLLSCNNREGITLSDINRVADLSARQCVILDKATPDSLMPRNYQNGALVTTKGPIKGWWIAGFFPGTCWYDYLLTGNKDVLQVAKKRTTLLSDPDLFYTNHDIGFQIMCSSGMAYKATGDTSYLSAIRRGAELLASRFSPVTGTIESWSSQNNEWKVIIDNMMNLELLTFAADKFNMPEYKEIAVRHARTTIENHFREDASCYHMVVYDRNDGSVIAKKTVQGYADESAWARGQAWALYGYSMMYRETGIQEFLLQAERVADYLLPRLKNRAVPCWDFDAPAETAGIDDSSAASVMASAFIELSGQVGDAEKSKEYLCMAQKMLKTLSGDNYLAGEGELSGFILKHATGHLPKGSEIDVPLTYGDYYYLEALYRLKSLLSPEISWSLMHPTELDSVYMKRVIEESHSHPVDNFEICGGCNSGCNGSLDGLLYFEEYPLAAAAQNTEIVKSNRENLSAIIRMSHAEGKKVWYWHREVLCNSGLVQSIPELLDQNGEFDLLGKAYEDLLRYKIRKTFECVPDLDGIVLTLTEASFSALHNSRPDIYPPAKVVEKVGRVFAEELQARGKRFILRSFGSIEEDYNAILAGAKELSKDYQFEVETKITPFDFNPFLPDNKFLVKSGKCTLGAECDVLGEFLGCGRMLPEHVDEIVRYVSHARKQKVDRYTIRLDRKYKSVFDVYPINLYAYEQAILHPEKTPDQIRREYYRNQYPDGLADTLVQMSKDGMECVKKTEFIAGNMIFHWYPTTANLKLMKAGGILGVFASEGDLSRARKQWAMLSFNKVPGRDSILREKAQAVEIAERNLALLNEVAPRLSDFDRKRMEEGWGISYTESRSLYELCKVICAYFDGIEKRDEAASDLTATYNNLLKTLDGEHLLRPVPGLAQRVVEEYPLELAMRKDLDKRAYDYVLPGCISDQNKVEHYMLGSFCHIENNRPVAVVGNTVYPDCYLALGLKASRRPVCIEIDGRGMCNVTVNGRTQTVDLDKKESIYAGPSNKGYEISITKAQGGDYPVIASVAAVKCDK